MTLTVLAGRYVDQRLAAGQINGRSAQQLRSRLRSFCAQAPADPARLTRRHVERWLDRPDLAASYRRGRLSALRGFCQWLTVHRHVRRDPTVGVPAPKVAEPIPRRLHDDEVRAVVREAAADHRSLLVVLLMLQEGLRRAEVAALDVEDVDWSACTVEVRGKGHQGQVSAVLPVSDETMRAMRRHLAAVGHRHGPLVRNRVRRDGRLAPSTVSDVVRRVMRQAGVDRPGAVPHSLRTTMGVHLLDRTRDLHAVRQAMRHVSVRTTEQYLRGSVAPLRDVMGGRCYWTGPDAA